MAEDLLSLIRAGKLRKGVILYHRGRRYPERTVTATVTNEGIQVNDRLYSTPSAAARAITGAPVDGWAFWRLPNGELLDVLRSQRHRIL